MRVTFLTTLGLVVFSCFIQAQTSKPLLIYVVDVEGGNATLFVSPRANRC